MKKTLTAIVLLLLIHITGSSQDYQPRDLVGEFGISLGAMNCNTDVEGKIADPQNFRPSGGIYAGLLYRDWVGLRLEATRGRVASDDKRAVKGTVRRRNLNFRSDISELSLIGELHPLRLIMDHTPALSIYLLAGVGYFSFNPQAFLEGRWIALQPLHTEGQGFPETHRPNYKLSQINIPAGGGLRYNLSERLVLRGEAVYRLLNTDYLDDVSTSYIKPGLFDKYLPKTTAELAKRLADRSAEITGNTSNDPGSKRGNIKKDSYYTVCIKLGIKLDNSGSSTNGSRKLRKSVGCYRF